MTTRKRIVAAAGAIAILLTGSPMASPAAMAQTAPDVSTSQPASSPLPAKGNATQQFSEATTRYSVEFTPYKSFSQLSKRIPETQALIEQLKKENALSLIPSQGSASKASDNLFIFQDTSFGACGSLGCAYLAFQRHEDGTFTNVLNVSIPGPIEVKIVNGEQSLLLCTHEGRFTEWKMQGDEMEPVPVPLDAEKEICTPTPEMTP